MVRIVSNDGEVRRFNKGKYKYYLHLAKENDIQYNTFYLRLKRGWGLREAATTPPSNRDVEYAIYKGDDLIITGTVQECADFMGVTAQYIYSLASPSRKKIIANRKNPDKATMAVRL